MKKLLALFSFIILTCGAVGSSIAATKDSTFPNKVKTHIGTLTFDHGIPTEETSKKLYYELDYHRAVQAYLWSNSGVGPVQAIVYMKLYAEK